MPRKGRPQSPTDIYHVIIRGINQQNIFEDADDCEKMLQIISNVKTESNCMVFAYCLMGNHCHLLVKTEGEDLAQIFKRIGIRYVYWFNQKYKRVGHLFQDRFKSEAIINEKQFMGVLRYIHQNPVAAGLCNDVAEYRWSSYGEFTGDRYIIDTAFVFELIKMDDFATFNRIADTETFLEISDVTFRFTDTEAKSLIESICGCSSTKVQGFDSVTRRRFLREFKEAGMSIRQINRLTGISKGIVERA
jgi:REP element-mobilizing transposase RayT